MSQLLSLSRAAHLIGVTRAALQKQVARGELVAGDGMVNAEDLLKLYPEVRLQDSGAFERTATIREEAFKRREDPDHSRHAIEASPVLRDVLQMVAEGRFSPGQPDRYHGLVHRVWHHDYFLVASDFDAYRAAQARVDTAYADRDGWMRMAAMNTARAGFFSSDRTIRGYMKDIWAVESAL